VPLHGLVDGMQFVLNCAVATQRGSFAQMRREVAPRLLTLAHSIELSLGLR
jgi:hypothetical protein